MDTCQSPCRCQASGEWECLKDPECETPAECVDVRTEEDEAWADQLGRDCEWFGAEPLRCILYGSQIDNTYGLTAAQSCCACEGGLIPETSNQPFGLNDD